MPIRKYIIVLILLSLSSSFFAFTIPPFGKNAHGKGIRLSIGPSLGIYAINKNHSSNLMPGPGVHFSYKKEIRFGRDYRTFFLYGFDYFFHTLSFQSYYFTQDTLKLYNKKFLYKYSMFLQEINIPFNVKYSFRRENNSQYTPYFMIGYHLRFMLPADLKISRNGEQLKTDSPTMKFKNYLIAEQMNAYLSAALGWQRNNTTSSKVGIFIEVNYRYGFSPYYFVSKYAASSLFINSSHVSLQVGMKF
jgi:hypothetical protein